MPLFKKTIKILVSLSPNARGFCITPASFAVQRMNSPNVITVPSRLRGYLESVKAQERQDVLLRAYRRNRGPLIISCDDKSLNHFLNRRYDRFQPQLHLASWGWKNNRSSGKNFSIVARGANPSFLMEPTVAPPKTFASLGLRPDFVEAACRLNFDAPTSVQALTIPRILSGANVVCAAETGSGKTFAYLAPLLQNVFEFSERFGFEPKENSPRILILTPTTELVDQVEGVCRILREIGGLNFEVIALRHRGNTSIAAELRLKRRMDVAIATPQLALNLIVKGRLKAASVQAVVLDEADTLLDDSFIGPIVDLLGRLKLRGFDALKMAEARDTVTNDVTDPLVDHAQLSLVSATLPPEFRLRLNHVVETESLVQVTTPLLHRVTPHVHHKFHRIKQSMKSDFFIKLLDDMWTNKGKPPTMIFCNKIPSVRFLDYLLRKQGIQDFAVLSKDVDTDRRLEILNQFHRGFLPLLLCSDLASRGVDTSRALNVINYEFPDNLSDYIHRAGRVGRVGSFKGGRPPVVVNLVSQKWEVDLLWKLEESVRTTEVLPGVDANIKRRLVERAKARDEPGEIRMNGKADSNLTGIERMKRKLTGISYEY